jgi:hypothetical protein
VGSGAGRILMLHANGRMQIDLLFAALVVLAASDRPLHGLDWLLRRLVRGNPKPSEGPDDPPRRPPLILARGRLAPPLAQAPAGRRPFKLDVLLDWYVSRHAPLVGDAGARLLPRAGLDVHWSRPATQRPAELVAASKPTCRQHQPHLHIQTGQGPAADRIGTLVATRSTPWWCSIRARSLDRGPQGRTVGFAVLAPDATMGAMLAATG